MEPQQEYLSQGRTGYILYKDQDGRLKLNYEFCGGNSVAIIYIPTVEEWTLVTGRPLSNRAPVLHYIADQTVKDKAPDCSYILSDGIVEIVENKN